MDEESKSFLDEKTHSDLETASGGVVVADLLVYVKIVKADLEHFRVQLARTKKAVSENRVRGVLAELDHLKSGLGRLPS